MMTTIFIKYIEPKAHRLDAHYPLINKEPACEPLRTAPSQTAQLGLRAESRAASCRDAPHSVESISFGAVSYEVLAAARTLHPMASHAG